MIRQRALLVARGIWGDASQEALEKQTQEDLDAAIVEAEAAGPPAPQTLFDDVYAGDSPALQEQRQVLDREIDATGRVVSPGFIDVHVHGEIALLGTPDQYGEVRRS